MTRSSSFRGGEAEPGMTKITARPQRLQDLAARPSRLTPAEPSSSEEIAARVSGPTAPVGSPILWPRAIRRRCNSRRSSREVGGSSVGQACCTPGRPRSRSDRIEMASA